MPKAKHAKWGEPKDSQLPPQRMTRTGLNLLKAKAQEVGSVSELLELVARSELPSSLGESSPS